VSAGSRPQRPGRLAVGDRVRLAGALHTVIAVVGTAVRLAASSGVVTEMNLAQLLMSEGFEMVSGSSRPPLPPSVLLDGLPEAVAAEALWWERHIVEVLRGVPPQAPAGTRPKPEYDPAVVSLTRREQAKAAELTAAGRPVTASAIAKRRRRYEARGVAGMADHRTGRSVTPHGRADPAVAEAMRQAIAEAEQESSRTATYLFWRTGQILEAAHGRGAVELPSQRSLYRLLDKLSAGKHTTGSARTRRSLADRPDGPFGETDAWAPGEVMQVDSTPLDVLVRLDDGVAGRVDLTGMIDVATRTVTAAVLRPTTKSVDASVLLARTVTPEPMRPGWADALAMSRSALPWQRLLDIDARLEHAAARPVIMERFHPVGVSHRCQLGPKPSVKSGERQRLLGVPCQVVMAAGEGIVGHGVETDVQLVAAQAKFAVGGYAAGGLPVLVEFCADVDVRPGPVPGPPVEQPGSVIKPVAVQSVAPVDDGAEARALNEHVAIEQVTVDDVPLARQPPGQRLQRGVSGAKGPGAGWRGFESLPPARDAVAVVGNGQQGLRPAAMGTDAIRSPDAMAPAGGDLDVTDGVHHFQESGKHGPHAGLVQVIERHAIGVLGDREVALRCLAVFDDFGDRQRR